MAVVAARATRLPIYSSFAKEGNLSDLFAKGEAISTLFNVMGIGAGIGLASTVCSTTQGKVHIYRTTFHRLFVGLFSYFFDPTLHSVIAYHRTCYNVEDLMLMQVCLLHVTIITALY